MQPDRPERGVEGRSAASDEAGDDARQHVARAPRRQTYTAPGVGEQCPVAVGDKTGRALERDHCSIALGSLPHCGGAIGLDVGGIALEQRCHLADIRDVRHTMERSDARLPPHEDAPECRMRADLQAGAAQACDIEQARKHDMPVGHDPNPAASAPTDADLQRSIQEWATRHELWVDCGFQSYADRIDGEPGETPAVTILHFDGDLGRALDGDFDGLDMEFFELLQRQGFWYERSDSVSAHIYPRTTARFSSPSSIARIGSGCAA